MPSISGNLQHAGSRFGSIASLTAIPNVPICLFNTANSIGQYVLTDTNGNFTFTSVPAGTYILVECGQSSQGISTPADFSAATTISKPTPSDPPYSSIISPIPNTNTVDSLSPNTLNLSVSTTNLTAENFIDSTIKNTPISIPTGVTVGPNILTLAGNGIWGTLPDGQVVNTCPTTYPYTNSLASSLLQYGSTLSSGPGTGANRFTMCNINTQLWFLSPNHTTFDETSSMLVINGGDPNAIIFQETVSVTPNSYYLAGAWLLMITNYPNTCLIGFRALASDGTTQLFYGETSDIVYTHWGQIGQIFNTKNNSQITLQVLSMSNIAAGNDFNLDDVTLQEVKVNDTTNLTKYVDKSNAAVGDKLIYTSVINTSSDINNLIFQDTIPLETTFDTGTVSINGTLQPSYNPITGFPIPNMSANSVATITFTVTINSLPNDYLLKNRSNLEYSLSIIPNNPIVNYITSNTVTTNLSFIKIITTKAVNKGYATLNDTLIYTITITNLGNIPGNSLIFQDTIPTGSSFINNSVSINGVSIPSANPELGITLNSISPLDIITITFMTKI